MSVAKSAVVRHARLAVLIAAASTAAIVESASANTYLGGLWNSASSWSDGNVPDLGSEADFTSDQTGLVQVNGGAMADSVRFQNGSNGYQIQGEPTAILTTRLVNNEGENNSIETAFIRGVNVDAEHGYLDINSGTLYAGALDHLTVSSNILNAQNFDDPNAGPAATDVYANGTFSGIFYNTGSTTIYGASRLIGTNGSVAASNNVTISHGTVYLDNTEGRRIDRLSNSAVVHLDAGELILKGDNNAGTINEIIGSMVVGAGSSGIAIQDNTMLSAGSSPTALTRDNTLRGTIHLNGENHLKLAPGGIVGGLVPYAIINSDNGYRLPVRYDMGADNIAGTSDDGGLVPVSTVSLPIALSTGGDVLIANAATLTTANKTISSLSLVGGSLNTGVNALTIASGVISIDNGSGGVALSGSSTISAGSGAEMIIYNHHADTELAGHLGGGNGLTITTYNDSEYLGSGNKVTLSGSNSYSGPTTINSGELVVTNAQAIPAGSTMRLFDCNVNLNYTPSAPITSRIILNGDVDLQSSARDNFLRDFRLKDNTTFTFSGGIEGHGAYFLQGTNATMSVTTPIGTTATAASANGFSIWPQETTTLRLNGQLGADNSAGSVIQFAGSTVGNGRITGGMQLSDGTLAPGSNGAAGTGILRMRDLGMYGGETHFNINGLTRGSGYDAIDVDNGIAISSDNKVILDAGGLTGTLGQRFELMHYSSIYSFSRPVFVSNLGSAAGTHWVPIWEDTKFSVAVAGPAGDSNLDGHVNFDDLVILAQHYNTDGSYLAGDSTNDGHINFDDLVVLAQNYNTKVAGLPGISTAFATDWALAQSLVPEPTTLAAIGVASLGVSRRRRSC